MSQGQQTTPTTIEGIYEVCIGVPEIIPALQYWQQFGYYIGKEGKLDNEAAQQLYGVNSALHSVRLYHQNADHGLLRLMKWERPLNLGLGMGSMKSLGNRWATTLTGNIINILNHGEVAKAMGTVIKYTQTYWEVIYNKDKKSRPFVEPVVGVREMMMLQPLARQVFFQRFGYEMPHYGSIDRNSPMETSQFTHMGLVIQDDSKQSLKFYEDGLGLLRSRDDVETSYESSLAGRDFFQLQPGEKFFVTAFDEPRSSVTDWSLARSGRLYIIRFPSTVKLESWYEFAQPGSLGMSLYTYRVKGMNYWCDRVKAHPIQKFTSIADNEFGERSFSFVAPDGYFWNLLES
ncbi:glyoxalase/bleomycin resistance protein/dioxygenase [Calothrix sp. 336/3]|uniref:glyoxalase/bleomycin resistance protein/dioxygenase n=1 Tax=Calothrix sp. 336/3 TaxID=1337936 RepID=UPI0004E44E7A|nr:glyoxalase/bleomycin resistance protein/dioxygenase [Calothrix sp. 336/3]AKG20588.1 glyoxalase/bleomycin resistance protein/dioxygenase [Calothrix sp. 336/3]